MHHNREERCMHPSSTMYRGSMRWPSFCRRSAYRQNNAWSTTPPTPQPDLVHIGGGRGWLYTRSWVAASGLCCGLVCCSHFLRTIPIGVKIRSVSPQFISIQPSITMAQLHTCCCWANIRNSFELDDFNGKIMCKYIPNGKLVAKEIHQRKMNLSDSIYT